MANALKQRLTGNWERLSPRARQWGTVAAISGTIVVWTAGGGKTTEIYGVDLQNGDIFAVTDAPGRQERPAVDGSVIVNSNRTSSPW